MDVFRTPGLRHNSDPTTLRFLRRLLLFFRPSAEQYSVLPSSGAPGVMSATTRLGCMLFCSLLLSEEIKTVKEIMTEIADMLDRSMEPLPVGFSAEAIEESM